MSENRRRDTVSLCGLRRYQVNTSTLVLNRKLSLYMIYFPSSDETSWYGGKCRSFFHLPIRPTMDRENKNSTGGKETTRGMHKGTWLLKMTISQENQ